MENTVALSELTELIGSVRGLVESQGNTEKRLFQMIEDSEKRSIQRDDDLRGLIKELKEEVQGEVRIVKNDLTPLKDESTGRKYHAGKMWTMWLISGGLILSSIYWIGNNFDNLRTNSLTHTLQIEQIFDKLGQVFDRLSSLEDRKAN